MTFALGVIADDFTGATDIASFLVKNGMKTIQLNGEHPAGLRAGLGSLPSDVDAVVVSLKNRSNPADEAVAKALEVATALRDAGAQQFYFKYCSTFDSTPQGNIGPVTDALLALLRQPLTVVCPALPVNGRTTYSGYLFVNGVPLNESGMRNHPVTPMTDASLVRLMEGQAEGTAGVITVATIDAGAEAVRAELDRHRNHGHRYVILDALTTEHLNTLGAAVADLPLITGGSGLGGGLAHALKRGTTTARAGFGLPDAPAVVFSGSSSEMTNRQVAHYRELAPHHALDIERVITEPDVYRAEVLQWYLDHSGQGPAPLIYATAASAQVQETQERFGAGAAGEAIERFFGRLALDLADHQVRTFIVAGGETSGAVTSALDITGFEVGAEIAPGVPLIRAVDQSKYLVLKSGNFGAETFFADAQRDPSGV